MPKRGWTFVLALLLQLGAAHSRDIGAPTAAQSWIIAASYVLLLAGVLSNLRMWGFRLLAVGAVLNMLAIALNGWRMPVSPEALVQAGLALNADPGEGLLSLSPKSVILAGEDTKLRFLTDILVITRPVRDVFSLGDVLVLTSGAFVLCELLLRRWLSFARAKAIEMRQNDTSD